MRTRRSALLALSALGLAPAGAARAAEELRLLVAGQAGAPTDRWARAFAPFLERHLQRGAVRVRNRGGSDMAEAAGFLAAQPPEGRLLGVVSLPAFNTQLVEQGRIELLDQVDFLAAVAEEPVIMVGGPVAADLGALRQVREGAIGTPPVGSAGHLLALALKEELPALSVLPFPTGVAARQAAQAGNVAAAIVSLGDALGPLRDGRLPGIASATVQRLPGLGVPSFTELGLVVPRPILRGFVLPKGVAAPQKQALLSALKATTADPEFIDQAKAAGFKPRFLDSAAWEAAVRLDARELLARWQQAPWRD